MRKIALLVIGVMVLSFAGAAMAQTYPAPPAQTQPAPTQPAQTQPAQTQPAPTQGQYPSVANLKPFSAEADYMSLAGYLRYLVFQQTSQWLTRQEATRIVNQQKGM